MGRISLGVTGRRYIVPVGFRIWKWNVALCINHLAFLRRKSKMATLYGSGKGLVRLIAGLQIMIGVFLFVFGIVVAVLVCHWTSKAGLGIWIGLIVSICYCSRIPWRNINFDNIYGLFVA